MTLSDPTTEPIATATTKAACGAWPGKAQNPTLNHCTKIMRYIEPHGHMVSRTTDAISQW